MSNTCEFNDLHSLKRLASMVVTQMDVTFNKGKYVGAVPIFQEIALEIDPDKLVRFLNEALCSDSRVDDASVHMTAHTAEYMAEYMAKEDNNITSNLFEISKADNRIKYHGETSLDKASILCVIQSYTNFSVKKEAATDVFQKLLSIPLRHCA